MLVRAIAALQRMHVWFLFTGSLQQKLQAKGTVPAMSRHGGHVKTSRVHSPSAHVVQDNSRSEAGA